MEGSSPPTPTQNVGGLRLSDMTVLLLRKGFRGTPDIMRRDEHLLPSRMPGICGRM